MPPYDKIRELRQRYDDCCLRHATLMRGAVYGRYAFQRRDAATVDCYAGRHARCRVYAFVTRRPYAAPNILGARCRFRFATPFYCFAL